MTGTDESAAVSPDFITVVSHPARTEIERIKGSRFVADISPADTPGAAAAFIDEVRDREPNASHHCWAFRIAIDAVRASDDGEPAGTAGPPILRRLESASLWQTAIVVSRYYGGTNLGTGGLIRAYGAAAAAAISVARLSEKRRMVAFTLRYPYDLSTIIERVVMSFSGRITSAEYTDVVYVTVSIPEVSGTVFINAIRNATSGAVIPQPT
jgi:uncharacterized YigZ family protein